MVKNLYKLVNGTSWPDPMVQFSRDHALTRYEPRELIAHLGGGWVNQAYSRLSTTHGHITDCKLDSVVYVGVCVVISHLGGIVGMLARKVFDLASIAGAN